MAQRIADMLGAFEGIGVTKERLEKRMGRKTESFTASDVAQMGVIYKSIHRGEVSREDEFPDDTAADATAALKAKAADAGPAPAPPAPMAERG